MKVVLSCKRKPISSTQIGLSLNAERPLPRGSASYGLATHLRLRRAAKDEYERELRQWYTSDALPLYGLEPAWRGHRVADEAGLSWPGGGNDIHQPPSQRQARVDKLALIHEAEDGARLKVSSYRAEASRRFIETIAANSITSNSRLPAWLRQTSEASVTGLRDRTWKQIEIAIDGSHHGFRLLAAGDEWVALARVENVYLIVHSSGFPLEKVSLVRIHNPEPYLQNVIG
jgi:hypothetical protein